MMRHGGWPFSNFPNTPFELNRSSPQAQGLIGWWPTLGSRGANVLRDMSGYGNDGSPVGTPTWIIDPVLGSGVHYNAHGEFFQVPDAPQLSGWPQFSLAVWFKTLGGAVHAAPGIVGKRPNAYGVAYSNATGQVFAQVWGVGGATGWMVISNTHGSITHFAMTYNGSDCICYLNGVYQLTDSDASGDVLSTNGVLAIGDREVVTSGNQEVYDVRLADRVWSPAVIWQMAHDKRWDLYLPLRRWWAMRAPSAGWRRHVSLTGVGVELS